MEPATRATCESCGSPADVRLDKDGSTWCWSCDTGARRLGYDNAAAHIIRERHFRAVEP